jgi:hypothetical protein
MKKIFLLLAIVTCLLACESVNYVPPVTPQMAAAKRAMDVCPTLAIGNDG